MSDTTERFLTASELGDVLRVSAETVRHWTRDGLIPSLRLPGGRFVFDSQAVLKALRDGQDAKRERRRPDHTPGSGCSRRPVTERGSND